MTGAGRGWPTGQRNAWFIHGGVATLFTATTFILAFVSMTRIRPTPTSAPIREHVEPLNLASPELSRVEQVQRNTPAPAATPESQTPVAAPPLTVETPTSVDTKTAVDTAAASHSATPAEATTPPAHPPMDSAIAGVLFQPVPIRVHSNSAGAKGGMSYGRRRAGVTSGRRTSDLSVAERDRLAISAMTGATVKAKERGLTPDEKAELPLQQAPGLSPVGRAARLPGEPMYAPLMSGRSSVAIVFPSGAHGGRDRSRDDSVYADYLTRLNHLQNIIIARRDSIRLDSLRRDSVTLSGKRPR